MYTLNDFNTFETIEDIKVFSIQIGGNQYVNYCTSSKL